MSNIFNKIKNILPYNFKYQSGNVGILISDRGRPDSNFRSIISASIINDLFKANAYVLTDRKKYSRSSEDFFKLYNIKKIYSSPKVLLKINLIIYFKVFLEIILFNIKILNKRDKLYWLTSKYSYLGIKIGDLIYDEYIRYDCSFIKPKIISLKFLKIFFSAIYKILIIDKNVKKYNIKFIISNQKAYISTANILLRYGTKKKLITILNGSNFIKFYKNYKQSLYYPYRVSEDLLRKLKKYPQRKIEKFYFDRLSARLPGHYVDLKLLKKLYSNYKNDNLIKLITNIRNRNYKTINVFALHAFSDSAHSFGDLVFNDYYDQFISTIKFLKKKENNKDAFWLIKPHPDLKSYGEENIVEDALKKFNVKNIMICPSNINNNILFKNIDNLITSVSTIGLEYSCVGKKPILSGLAPYYKKGLFHYIKSKKDYFKMLENIHLFRNKISKKQTGQCKRILFVLENMVNLNLSKSHILPRITQGYEKDSDTYVNEVYKNFKSFKNKSLYNDLFYKDLKKIIVRNIKKYKIYKISRNNTL